MEDGLHTDVARKSVDAIIPYTNNPKEHPDEQVQKIASSIKNYGWDQPIVVDGENEIIKGHGRLQAAQLLGLEEVPVITRTDLSDAEKRASRIADNKTAESAWLEEDLTLELEQLQEEDYDLELTGFEDDELEDLLESAEEDELNGLESEPLADKKLEDVKILDLYAGIGGNRKLWGDKPNVTAVEWNETIAEAYGDFYPEDEVVVGDAHEYLLEHFDEFDFIWTSPPCPTHSKMRKGFSMNVENPADPVYPDMKLYEEVLLLQGYFEGKWVVENVDPWYEPLIEPQKSGRHMFWSNFDIPDIESKDNVQPQGDYDPDAVARDSGYDPEKLSQYNFPSDYPRNKIINNMVHPEVGKVILDAALE